MVTPFEEYLSAAKGFPVKEVPPDAVAVVRRGLLCFAKQQEKEDYSLEWMRDRPFASEFEIRYHYIVDTFRAKDERRITAKEYDRAVQDAMASRVRIPMATLRSSIQMNLHDLLSDAARFAALAQNSDLMRFGLENLIAIHLQAPQATRVFTLRELKDKGITPVPGQQPIQVMVPVSHEYFRRADRQLPLGKATLEEQREILAGNIPVEAKITFALNQVYDVSQLEMSVEQQKKLRHTKKPSYQELLELATQIKSPDGRNLNVEECQMPAVTAVGFFHAESNTIRIREGTPTTQKTVCLVDRLAEVLIAQTSISPADRRPLEIQVVSAALHNIMGVPFDGDHCQCLERTYAAYVATHSDPKLEELAAKAARVTGYIQDGLHTLAQSRQQDLEMNQDQEQSEILTNFLHGLE